MSRSASATEVDSPVEELARVHQQTVPSVYVFGLDIPCWSRVVGREGVGDAAGAPSIEDPLEEIASVEDASSAGSDCGMVELGANGDPLGMAVEDLPVDVKGWRVDSRGVRGGEDAGGAEPKADVVSVRG